MDYSLFLRDPGIYTLNGKYYNLKTKKKITDEKIINRLHSIKVPPAWKNVWYAYYKKCHIQAHGIDSSGKKQYILNETHITNKKYEKFHRMKQLIKKINSFKKLIRINNYTDLSKENIIKLLFNLLLETHIRVGNEVYSKNNKTYGLTTLRKRHLIYSNNSNDEYFFNFIGKSKIEHSIQIPEKYHPLIIKLRDNNNSKNNNFFWYLSEGNKINISSDILNEYIKKNMGEQFTCKDLRTYSANVLFIEYFLKNVNSSKTLHIINNQSTRTTLHNMQSNNQSKNKIILESIKQSAQKLGHSRGICKKSYISDSLLNYCLESFDSAKLESKDSLLNKLTGFFD